MQTKPNNEQIKKIYINRINDLHKIADFNNYQEDALQPNDGSSQSQNSAKKPHRFKNMLENDILKDLNIDDFEHKWTNIDKYYEQYDNIGKNKIN